jgi:hypothetical protein
MFTSRLIYWLSFSFIIWVIGIVFYTLGTQADKNRATKVSSTIFFLISIGIFIAISAYSPLLGLTVSLKYEATLSSVEKLVNLSIPECSEILYEEGVQKNSGTNTYYLGKLGPNVDIQSLMIHRQKKSDEVEKIEWVFKKKKDFEKTLGELKKFKSSKDKGLTNYYLPNSIYTINRNGFIVDDHNYIITVSRKGEK